MKTLDPSLMDKELAFIRKHIRMGAIQPLNYEKEMRKLFKDRTYNPTFTYDAYPHDLHAMRQRLTALSTNSHTTPIATLLEERKREFLTMLDALHHRGNTAKFTTASIKLYGEPTPSVVANARKILNLEDTDEPRPHDTFHTTKKFLDALLSRGLNWRVEKKDMIVNASFSTTDKVVYINKDRRFSDHDLKRLMVHEIGTHVMRAERAKQQKYRMFLYGFPHYLETEEGLAVYNEDACGLLSTNILRRYAGRVLAVHLSLHNSFSTVYNSLLEYFTKQDAWTLTLRAKRGTGNTSIPGAYTKDHLYLTGYYTVKHFVKKGGNIDKLYVGKIGVEHVPLIGTL